MFREATQATAAHEADLYSNLGAEIDALEKTARTWFDNTSHSVKSRRATLTKAAFLANRVAGFIDDEEERAELKVLADNLYYQANELADVQQVLANEEYGTRVSTVNTPAFSDRLADESRLAARRETDWDIFMSVEPRLFVANNPGVDDDEIKIRAFAYIEDALSGHGLGRTAKKNIATLFIDQVSKINNNVNSNNTKTASQVEEEISSEDTATLYF